MKETFNPIILLLALLATISSADAQSGPPPMQEVEATGQAADADAAFKQAVNDAVRQVVGTLVSAENVVNNERVIKDEVLTLSNGFVEKVLKQEKTKQPDGSWEVKLKCIVRKGRLYSRLKEAKVPTVKFDGVSVFADVVSQIDHQKSSVEMIQSALKAFSPKLVTATMLGEKPSIVTRDEKYTEVKIDWIASVDVNWFFKNCAPALDAAFTGAAISKSIKLVLTPIKETKDSGVLLRGGENIVLGTDPIVEFDSIVALPVEKQKNKWGIVFYHIDKRVLEQVPPVAFFDGFKDSHPHIPEMYVIAYFRDDAGRPLLVMALDCLQFRTYPCGREPYKIPAHSYMPLIGHYGINEPLVGSHWEGQVNRKLNDLKSKKGIDFSTEIIQLSINEASGAWSSFSSTDYYGATILRMQNVVRIPTGILSKISKIELKIECHDTAE